MVCPAVYSILAAFVRHNLYSAVVLGSIFQCLAHFFLSNLTLVRMDGIHTVNKTETVVHIRSSFHVLIIGLIHQELEAVFIQDAFSM